jgi:hypothetical protein
VGPRAGLDVCEKSRSDRDFFKIYFCSVCPYSYTINSMLYVITVMSFYLHQDKLPTLSLDTWSMCLYAQLMGCMASFYSCPGI